MTTTTDTQGATLTTAEVAALCRIAPKTVPVWIANGYLPKPVNHQDRHGWRFSRAKVFACLEGRRG